MKFSCRAALLTCEQTPDRMTEWHRSNLISEWPHLLFQRIQPSIDFHPTGSRPIEAPMLIQPFFLSAIFYKYDSTKFKPFCIKTWY